MNSAVNFDGNAVENSEIEYVGDDKENPNKSALMEQTPEEGSFEFGSTRKRQSLIGVRGYGS